MPEMRPPQGPELVMTNSDDTLYLNMRAKTPEVEIYDSAFAELRPAINGLTSAGVTVLISTGRNAQQVSHITEQTGMNGLCICEMGQTVFVPNADGSDFARGKYVDDNLNVYRLAGGGKLYLPAGIQTTQHANGFSYPAVHGHYPRYRRAWEELRKVKEMMNLDRLRYRFGDTTLRWLSERENIVTFEMDQRTGEEFKQFVLFGEAELLTEEARRLIAEGSLITISSKGALDIQPPVTKETTARHVMSVYNVDPMRALYIGDSDHSDGPVVSIVKCGGAVANSDAALKVRVEAKGENGYVSPHSYTAGTLDILRHFFP